MKNKTIDDCFIKSKYDLILYIVISILLLIVNIIICIKFDLNTSNTLIVLHYMLLILFSFTIIKALSKLFVYFNIKRIISYIKNEELNVGNIIFWNESDYLLTDNYLVIINKNTINCVDYADIEKIYKEVEWKINRKRISMKELLHIISKDDEEYVIPTNNLNLSNKEIRDNGDFILSKNHKIKDITNKMLEEKKYDIKGTIFYIIKECISIILFVISYFLYKEYINEKIIVNLLLSLVFFIFTLITYPKTNYLFKRSDFYNKNKNKIIIMLIICVIILLCVLPE